MMSIRQHLLLLAWSSLPITCSASLTHTTNKFIHWYGSSNKIAQLVQSHCSVQYEEYLGEIDVPDTTLFPSNDPGCKSCYISPMIDCLMSQIDDQFKLNMATAGIALGLMPTLLTFASTTTVEIGLLAIQRPVLAFLLSAASPAVSPTRTFTYRSPFEILKYSASIREAPTTAGWSAFFVPAIQYLLALGAAANVVHNTWELSMYVIYMSTPETAFVPLLFTTLALSIHIAGSWALYLSVELVADVEFVPTGVKTRRHVAFLQHELTPCALRHSHKLVHKPESYLFLAVSWLTSAGTVLYLFWSTYTLGSALFITVYDAQIAITRYLVSIFVCRMVLMYEISGMKRTISLQEN